jgi:hypothetical protein
MAQCYFKNQAAHLTASLEIGETINLNLWGAAREKLVFCFNGEA